MLNLGLDDNQAGLLVGLLKLTPLGQQALSDLENKKKQDFLAVAESLIAMCKSAGSTRCGQIAALLDELDKPDNSLQLKQQIKDLQQQKSLFLADIKRLERNLDRQAKLIADIKDRPAYCQLGSIKGDNAKLQRELTAARLENELLSTINNQQLYELIKVERRLAKIQQPKYLTNLDGAIVPPDAIAKIQQLINDKEQLMQEVIRLQQSSNCQQVRVV